jgi:CRP/FNR family transcriptional regulator, cyclic AMP receptor protein
LDPVEAQQLMSRLSQGSWFGRMPLALRELVIARSRVRTYTKGQLLSIEGSPPKGLFAVLEGQVHVVATLASGDEALVHVGEPGIWLGEFGVLTGAKTIATFIAQSKVRALFFPATQFDLIVDEEPRYYRHFANLVYERYAALLRAFVEVQEVTPDVRLRRRLSVMAQLQQSDRATAGPISLGVTQAELSRMIGVSRQTLNTLLGSLQQQGLIELGFRRITVLDPNRLGELTEVSEAELRTAAAGPRGPRSGGDAGRLRVKQ